jgi:hypothetical protein
MEPVVELPLSLGPSSSLESWTVTSVGIGQVEGSAGKTVLRS